MGSWVQLPSLGLGKEANVSLVQVEAEQRKMLSPNDAVKWTINQESRSASGMSPEVVKRDLLNFTRSFFHSPRDQVMHDQLVAMRQNGQNCDARSTAGQRVAVPP